MKTTLSHVSVVVVGNVHNPSILNPDFLAIRQIVPAEWEWEVSSECLTTPPLAIVKFKQGVTITVEHQKLQVIDESGADPTQSRIAEIARRYVTTLPHVRYTAVGINIQGLIAVDQPDRYLRERFLKPGAWDSAEPHMEALGLRFVYPLESGRVVLSLDTGEATEKERERDQPLAVLVANANFHRDCGAYPADREVLKLLDEDRASWAAYKALIQRVVGVEWKTE